MTAKLGKGYRVLVVGYEQALVKYFSVFLKIYGYEVNTALSVAEAFRKAERHPPNILIVMVLMPEMFGLEVGLRIWRQSHCSVLFVAAIGIQAFDDMLGDLREKGCACMALPLLFENSELLAKLKAATKGQQPHGS